MKKLKIKDYTEGFKNREFKVLAKAISLVESTLDTDKELARKLLEKADKSSHVSRVIGITGSPGVGKSTFLNSFGKKLLSEKKTMAILSIDPSSDKTGGSILGDKTRMSDLVNSTDVFIRPSASGTLLGGVAAKTKETIDLCEYFGFDYIFVESVGVGQSEVLLAKMVDYLLLLISPAGGDDIQGIKRGILEHVDQIIVNKNDGDFEKQASLTGQLYLDSCESEPILVSSLENKGIEKIFERVERWFEQLNILERRNLLKEDLFRSLLEMRAVSEVKKYCDQNKEIIKKSLATKSFQKTLDEALNLIIN